MRFFDPSRCGRRTPSTPSTTVPRSPPAPRTTATSSRAWSKTSCLATGRCVATESSAASDGTRTGCPSKWRSRRSSASQDLARSKHWASIASTRPPGLSSTTPPWSGTTSPAASDDGSTSRTTTGRWTSASWSRCGGASNSSGTRAWSTERSRSCRIHGAQPPPSPISRSTSGATAMSKTRRSPFACRRSRHRRRRSRRLASRVDDDALDASRQPGGRGRGRDPVCPDRR